MSLKDRVLVSSGLIKIIKENSDERQAYIGFYTLRNKVDFIPTLKKMAYWNLQDNNAERIETPDCFIYIEERYNDQVLERYRLPDNKAPYKSLGYEISPGRRYGRNACIITLRWVKGETIHRSHIFLMNKAGEKFPFVTKTFGAPGRLTEQYVFKMRDWESLDDYNLGFSADFLQKYRVY